MQRAIFTLITLALTYIATMNNVFANNISKIDVNKDNNNNIILTIFFERITEQPKISPKHISKEFTILIPDGSVKNYQPPNLPKSIKHIELSKKLSSLEIKICLIEPRKPIYQIKNNKLNIIFQKEKEVFPYDLPKIPEKIQVPFESKKYIGEKISVDIQNADIKSVLRMLSEIGNINIVLGEEIQGKITLKVKDIPWDQVLDIVMARFGLGKATLDGVIFIAPLSTLQRRAEELKNLKHALAAEEEIGPTKTEYITLNYINACELITNEKASIKNLLSSKGVITCDDRTNILIVKDTEENIQSVKNLISKLDIPTKQVLIEARIVEASSNLARNLGIQWFGGYYKTNRKTNFRISPSNQLPAGNAGRPNQNGEIYNTTSPPFGPIVDLAVPATSRIGFAIGHITKTSALLLDLHLSALEQQGQGKIVSSPRIITRDNGEAIIRQGYKIPYLELTEQGTATTKFIDADLTLKVIPHILPNNEIRLEINIDKSEPDWAKQVNGVPAILTRSAQTFVRVPNGGTVVIGGLKIAKKQESYGKVPGLSKIPAVGNLFKNSKKTQEEQELLIFITSKVITSAVEEIDY